MVLIPTYTSCMITVNMVLFNNNVNLTKLNVLQVNTGLVHIHLYLYFKLNTFWFKIPRNGQMSVGLRKLLFRLNEAKIAWETSFLLSFFYNTCHRVLSNKRHFDGLLSMLGCNIATSPSSKDSTVKYTAFTALRR